MKVCEETTSGGFVISAVGFAGELWTERSARGLRSFSGPPSRSRKTKTHRPGRRGQISRAFRSATMSSYWCAGRGDVIENWCRCDLNAFSKEGLPTCSSLRQPVLRLAPHLEPSSTMAALEWLDVEPLIGCKVSDYIIQHKKVEDPSEAEIYTAPVVQEQCRSDGVARRELSAPSSPHPPLPFLCL
ncbi:hypothetical protein COCON_G00161460 [Conger conger]|uniref:Astrotactin-1/2 Fn3 domain-containing protein n=1 Tax=Conger conger TaxID=82655 RepID=A0A9Q1DB36_CONCO|nr:hypothetical protein COCON_G00161460 [Conger conger]